VAILTGLATAIPLVIKLIQYVQKAIREKNWTTLLTLITNLMETAEANPNFKTGEERKIWVIEQVKAASKTINYDVDIQAVSDLIDSLCALTKKVNAK
jgi:hypothetical protein